MRRPFRGGQERPADVPGVPGRLREQRRDAAPARADRAAAQRGRGALHDARPGRHRRGPPNCVF